jgi:hypothetical protein
MHFGWWSLLVQFYWSRRHGDGQGLNICARVRARASWGGRGKKETAMDGKSKARNLLRDDDLPRTARSAASAAQTTLVFIGK